MVDRFHMHRDNLCRWNGAANLADIFRVHRNGTSTRDIRRSAGVHNNHIWRKLLQGSLNFWTPDCVARDIQDRFFRRLQDKAGDRSHLFTQFTVPVLAPGTIDVKSLPREMVNYRENPRETGLLKRGPVLRLTEQRQMLWQHSPRAGIPMIAMRMCQQNRVDTCKQLLQFPGGEWQRYQRETLLIARVGNRLHRFERTEHRINQECEVMNTHNLLPDFQ